MGSTYIYDRISFSTKTNIAMRRNTSLRNSRKDIPGNFVATVSWFCIDPKRRQGKISAKNVVFLNDAVRASTKYKGSSHRAFSNSTIVFITLFVPEQGS